MVIDPDPDLVPVVPDLVLERQKTRSVPFRERGFGTKSLEHGGTKSGTRSWNEVSTPFGCLVADPPWQFGDKLPGPGRGAAKHYQTLSVAELCAFDLPALANDAYLFLWRVSAMQAEALDVIRAWGFTLKTEFVWCKRTATGKRWFGMGRTLRAEHETCLVATRGKPKVLNRSTRSTFEAAVPDGRHSAKPEEFFDLIESLVPGPYVELFARRVRPGWTCLGNDPALSTGENDGPTTDSE